MKVILSIMFAMSIMYATGKESQTSVTTPMSDAVVTNAIYLQPSEVVSPTIPPIKLPYPPTGKDKEESKKTSRR